MNTTQESELKLIQDFVKMGRKLGFSESNINMYANKAHTKHISRKVCNTPKASVQTSNTNKKPCKTSGANVAVPESQFSTKIYSSNTTCPHCGRYHPLSAMCDKSPLYFNHITKIINKMIEKKSRQTSLKKCFFCRAYGHRKVECMGLKILKEKRQHTVPEPSTTLCDKEISKLKNPPVLDCALCDYRRKLGHETLAHKCTIGAVNIKCPGTKKKNNEIAVNETENPTAASVTEMKKTIQDYKYITDEPFDFGCPFCEKRAKRGKTTGPHEENTRKLQICCAGTVIENNKIVPWSEKTSPPRTDQAIRSEPSTSTAIISLQTLTSRENDSKNSSESKPATTTNMANPRKEEMTVKVDTEKSKSTATEKPSVSKKSTETVSSVENQAMKQTKYEWETIPRSQIKNRLMYPNVTHGWWLKDGAQIGKTEMDVAFDNKGATLVMIVGNGAYQMQRKQRTSLTIVSPHMVEENDYTGEVYYSTDTGLHTAKLAYINLKSPYITGRLKVMVLEYPSRYNYGVLGNTYNLNEPTEEELRYWHENYVKNWDS